MERSEHAAIKFEATPPESICAGAASPAANAWWLFGALSPESAKVSPLAKVFVRVVPWFQAELDWS